MRENGHNTSSFLERPTQAVILAGGRGTRLRPLTDTRPKPMIEIHGKPFLEYMIEMLRGQGFNRILLLLGYLPEAIQDYFGDGRRWGVRISYSVTLPDDLTSHRVRVTLDQLDPCFLLLYCDNYWPMRVERMWERFVNTDAHAMVTVYSNKDKYSRDSVLVGDDGKVLIFDRSRTTPGLRGVEISYALITKEALKFLPEEGDALFEEAIYMPLARMGKLAAYVTDHRYYSIGSIERLPQTERFLARRPAIILDRDGVLNKRPPKADYVTAWEQFEWLPGAKEALRMFKEANYQIIVITNQAGVARRAMSSDDVENIHARLKEEATRAGGRIDAIYCCPHHWDENCECRKPKPGMLFQAQRDFDLDLSRTIFIGDDERDAEAADAAGCPSQLVTHQTSLFDITCNLLNGNQHDQ